MRNKFAEVLNMIQNIKGHSVAMQHKLMLYWGSMLLAIFGALLVVLSATGVFRVSEQKVQQLLEVQHKNVTDSMNKQIDLLTAQGIAISEETSDLLDNRLYRQPVTLLNNQAQELEQIERELYSILNTALKSNPCNGAYVILDATINTEAAGADRSRAGLYLRFANLNAQNAVDQDVTLYRGIADIARENRVELHNRWKMEFNVSLIDHYEGTLSGTEEKLSESCFWTAREHLTDTWENMFLLVVPIQGSDGSIRGICGVELSELYMQLSYPAQESMYGNIVTILAPVKDDYLLTEKGIVCGSGGTFLDATDELLIERGRRLNSYTGQEGKFLGVHSRMDVETAEGIALYAVTLIPEAGLRSISHSERLRWSTVSLVFLVTMLAVAVILSRRFVQPIKKIWETLP